MSRNLYEIASHLYGRVQVVHYFSKVRTLVNDGEEGLKESGK